MTWAKHKSVFQDFWIGGKIGGGCKSRVGGFRVFKFLGTEGARLRSLDFRVFKFLIGVGSLNFGQANFWGYDNEGFKIWDIRMMSQVRRQDVQWCGVLCSF